jgi:CheW-like domain
MLSSRQRPPRGRAPRPGYLAFRLAGQGWSLPLQRVAAVAELRALTRLPSADPLKLGVIVHRGVVVPVIDLGRRLGGAPYPDAAAPPQPLCIVLRSEPPVSFPVDEVLGFRHGPPPPGPAAGTGAPASLREQETGAPPPAAAKEEEEEVLRELDPGLLELASG